MTLEMAAVIEEFSDDAPAVERPERTAATDPQRFNHAAQRIRDDRKRADGIASMTAEIEAQGLAVVTENVLSYDSRDRWPRSVTSTPQRRLPDIADVNGAYIGHTYNGELNMVFLHAGWKAAGLTFPGRTQTGGSMTEEETAERRTVIENNRAWDAAETVRMAFLKDLLAAKSMPKDAPQYIAQASALTVTQSPTECTKTADSLPNCSEAATASENWPE